jgi:predicted small secreted protein
MTKRIAKALFALFAVAAAASSLTACNTVRGMGQDMSAAGHAITGTAQQAERH